MLDLELAANELAHIDKRFIQMAWDIVDREGGYVDDKDDSGGATNHGLSLKYARTQGSIYDLNHDGKVDAEDIKLVTPAMAVVNFLMEFLIDPGIPKLPSCVRECAFDSSVNNGPQAAIKLVQIAVNRIAVADRISEDGRIGPKTLLAAHDTCDAVGEVAFLNTLVDVRRDDYKRIAAVYPKNQKYLKGWLNRAESFRKVT